MYEKKYQFFGPRGIEWTSWFPCKKIGDKWQLKSSKLKNEYRKLKK